MNGKTHLNKFKGIENMFSDNNEIKVENNNRKIMGKILMLGDWTIYFKVAHRVFPGGSVVKNPTAIAGDTGLIRKIWEDPTCHTASKPVHHNY